MDVVPSWLYDTFDDDDDAPDASHAPDELGCDSLGTDTTAPCLLPPTGTSSALPSSLSSANAVLDAQLLAYHQRTTLLRDGESDNISSSALVPLTNAAAAASIASVATTQATVGGFVELPRKCRARNSSDVRLNYHRALAELTKIKTLERRHLRDLQAKIRVQEERVWTLLRRQFSLQLVVGKVLGRKS